MDSMPTSVNISATRHIGIFEITIILLFLPIMLVNLFNMYINIQGSQKLYPKTKWSLKFCQINTCETNHISVRLSWWRWWVLAVQLCIRPDTRQKICFDDYFWAFRTFFKISVQESPFLYELLFDASGIFFPAWSRVCSQNTFSHNYIVDI